MDNDVAGELDTSRSFQQQLNCLRENPNAASVMARVRQRFNEQRMARSLLNSSEDDGTDSTSQRETGTNMDQNTPVTCELLWDVLLRLTDNKSVVMKQAESELFALESQPGYYTALFEILLSPEVQTSVVNEHQAVRMMVAVILRKDVERHWAAGGNRSTKSHKLNDDVKTAIRARIVDACLSELRNETSRAVADVIAKIARHDVPEPWDNLIQDDLLKRLSASTDNVDRAVSEANLVAVGSAVEATARCAFLLERVLKSVASKRFIKHRAFFTNLPDQLFDPVGGIWMNLLAKMRMFVDVNDPATANQTEFVSVRSRTLDAILSVTKLLHHIIVFGVSVQLRDAAHSKEDGMEEAVEIDEAEFAAATNRVQEKLLNFFQLVYDPTAAQQSSSVYDQIKYLRIRCMQNTSASSQQRLVCDTILKRLDKIVSRVVQNVGLTESVNAFLPVILERYQNVAFGGGNELERASAGSLHQSLIILSSVITNAPTNFGAQQSESTAYRCQLVADAFPEHLFLKYTRCLVRYAVLDEASRERLEENAEEFAIHSAPLEALNIDLRTSAQYCLARLTKLRCEAVLQALFTLLSEPMMPPAQNRGPAAGGLFGTRLSTSYAVANHVSQPAGAVTSTFHREALYSLIMCIKPQLFDYINTTKSASLLTQLHCKLHEDLHELLQLHRSLSSQHSFQQHGGGGGDNSRKRTETTSNTGDDDIDDELGLGVVVVCHRIVMTYGEYFFMPASDADCDVIRATLEQLQQSGATADAEGLHNGLFDHYKLLLHAVSRRIAPPVMVRLAAVDVLQRRVFCDPKWTDAAHLAPYSQELLYHMEHVISDCRSNEAREFVLSTVRCMVMAFRETQFPVPPAYTINLCRTTLCLNTKPTNSFAAAAAAAVRSSRSNKRFCNGAGGGDGIGAPSSSNEPVKSDISDIQLQTKVCVAQALYLALQDSIIITATSDNNSEADRHQHVTFLMGDLVAALVLETLKPLVNESFAEETLALYRELLKRMPTHEYMQANAAEVLLDSAIRQLLQSSSATVRLTRQLPKQIAELLVEYALLLPQYCAHTYGLMMIQWFLNVLRSRPPPPSAVNNKDMPTASGTKPTENADLQHITLTRDEQTALVESLSTLVLLFAAVDPQLSSIQNVLPDLTRFALFQARLPPTTAGMMSRVNEIKPRSLNSAAGVGANDSGGSAKDSAGGRYNLDACTDILCARVMYTAPIATILLVIRESCVIPAAELAFAEHYYGHDAADAVLRRRRAAERESSGAGGIDIACRISARVNTAASHAVMQLLSTAGKPATGDDNVMQLSDAQISDICERVLACTVQSMADNVRTMERYASKWVFLIIVRLLDDNICRVQYMSTFLLHFLNEIMVKQVRVCPRKRSPATKSVVADADTNDSQSSLLPDTLLMLDLIEKNKFHPEQATTPGERRRIELIDSNDAAYRVYTPGALLDMIRKLRRRYGSEVFESLLQSNTAASMPAYGTFLPMSSNSANNMAIAFQMSAAAVAPLFEHVMSEPTDSSV